MGDTLGYIFAAVYLAISFIRMLLGKPYPYTWPIVGLWNLIRRRLHR